MWVTRLKSIAVLLLALTMLGAGGGLALHRMVAAPPAAGEDEPVAGPAAKPPDVAPAAAAQPQNDAAKKIRELQKERVTTLKAVADQQTQQFKNGLGTPEELLQARQQLLMAELDMADNEQDRIRIYEKTVEVLRGFERIAEQHARAAVARAPLPLKAKAARLEAEIELERARLKAARKGK